MLKNLVKTLNQRRLVSQRRRAMLALLEGQTLNCEDWTCCKVDYKYPYLNLWYQTLVAQYAARHNVGHYIPFYHRAQQTKIKDLDYATYVYRRQFLINLLTSLK